MNSDNGTGAAEDLAVVTRLSDSQIDEVIHDLNLMRDGWELIYAVDPHEIVDYCFPIKPDAPPSDLNASEISSDQVALHQLFHVFNSRPLLVQDYHPEVLGLADAIRAWISKAYEDVELVDALIRAADIGQLAPEMLHEETLRTIEKNFANIVAVVLGIYELGTRRFQQVVNSRMHRFLGEYKDPGLKEVEAQYKETPLARKIFGQLRMMEKNRLKASSLPESIQKNILASKLPRHNADALAIDRILFMNREFRRAFEATHLDSRYLVLYVSSAAKSRRVFSISEVRKALPRVEGDFYPILRTRDQLFAMAAFRGIGRSKKDKLKDSVAKLKNFRDVVRKVGRLSAEWGRATSQVCEGCALHGGDNSRCGRFLVCSLLVQQSFGLTERKDALQNLGLVEGLGVYKRFIEEKPKVPDWQEFVDFFRRVLGSRAIQDRAMERIRLDQIIITAKVEFSRDLPGALRLVDLPGMMEARDVVTSASQVLPLRLRLQDERLQDLLQLLERAIRDRFTNHRGMLEVYERFMEIDVMGGELGIELELMRCVLYQASPSVQGDDKARVHIERLLKLDTLTHEQRHEMMYLLVWIMRRLKNYSRGIRIADKELKRDPADPRFYHGRLLAKFAWFSDEKRDCPFPLFHARRDAVKALELYARGGTHRADYDIVGALWNDLAYLWSLEGNEFAIGEARKSLLKLKETLPKPEWERGYPEYFHTEATIELEEVRLGNRKLTPAELELKLRSALQDIRIACRLFPKKSYEDLARRLEWELEQFVAKSSISGVAALPGKAETERMPGEIGGEK